MLAVYMLMIATGISDGQLEMAEPLTDRILFTQEQCQGFAKELNKLYDDSPTYIFCLDYQEAVWNRNQL